MFEKKHIYLPERRMTSSTSKPTNGRITSPVVTVTRRKDAAPFINRFKRQTLENRAAKVKLNPTTTNQGVTMHATDAPSIEVTLSSRPIGTIETPMMTI